MDIADDESLTEEELEEVFTWVDGVPLTRPKKNINRDFSDCSLLAEIIKFYLPHSHKSIIQVHNYIQTGNKDKKLENWRMLNKKVLSKLNNFKLKDHLITQVVDCQNGAVEKVLKKVKIAIDRFKISKPKK